MVATLNPIVDFRCLAVTHDRRINNQGGSFLSRYSKEFLNNTIEVWQPYSPTPLFLHDAREITGNITALFNFLISNEKDSNNKDGNKNILSKKNKKEGGKNE